MAVDTGIKPTAVCHQDAPMVFDEPAQSIILNLLWHAYMIKPFIEFNHMD